MALLTPPSLRSLASRSQHFRIAAPGKRMRWLSAAASESSAPSSSKSTTTISGLASSSRKKNADSQNYAIRVGAPFVLFSVLAAWVVSNALDGRIREMETAKGKASKSLRQAALEAEHEDMMERLNKIVEEDFDNTKRIKRPEEVLAERRAERERRNRWYNRAWRAVVGESKPK